MKTVHAIPTRVDDRKPMAYVDLEVTTKVVRWELIPGVLGRFKGVVTNIFRDIVDGRPALFITFEVVEDVSAPENAGVALAVGDSFTILDSNITGLETE